MQAVLAIILLALLAGLFWSLWFVLTNPRRRARLIATELSAPLVRVSAPMSVGYRRWGSAGAAAFFALIAGNVVSRSHDAATVVVVLALSAPFAAYYARLALIGKPVLVIDGDGVVTSRPPGRLRWDDIETIAIEESSGIFGIERQSLVLHLAPQSVELREQRPRGVAKTENETLTIPLDLLSPGWHQIARAIYERSGRRPEIPSKYGSSRSGSRAPRDAPGLREKQ